MWMVRISESQVTSVISVWPIALDDGAAGVGAGVGVGRRAGEGVEVGAWLPQPASMITIGRSDEITASPNRRIMHLRC